MQQYKLPSVYTALLGDSLVTIGGILGWFTLSSNLKNADSMAGNMLQSNLTTKNTNAIVIGILCFVLTIVIINFKKRWVQLLPLLLSGFICFAAFNQLSSLSTGSSIGLNTGIGYWVSLIGSIAAVVGSIWLIATYSPPKTKKTK